MKRIPALSIRQPHAEQILRGKKKIEYRGMPTNKRELVYIYASKTPADQEAWNEIGLEPGDLPTGVIVGTVEVVGCRLAIVHIVRSLISLRRHRRYCSPLRHR